MRSAPEHKPFLAAILENPGHDAALLVYADWLEEHGDTRCGYLRTQVEYRKSRHESLRRRLIDLYPHEHLAWTATLEQAGAVEANLTKYDFAWWGTKIGTARPSQGTYERFEYHDQPPLPVETLDGDFDWLRASEPLERYQGGPLWTSFCTEKRQQGYFVPSEFERFLGDRDLPARVKSCTANVFAHPPVVDEASAPFRESDAGLLMTFYVDSQYCVLWTILLPREPGRYAPILAGPPDALFPGFSGEPGFSNEHYPGKPVLAASQFEQFIYRWWIENEIWFATVPQDSRRTLTPREQAYVDHLQRRYADRRRRR